MGNIEWARTITGEEAVPARLMAVPSLSVSWSPRYRAARRTIDIIFVLIAFPMISGIALALIIANPFFNPGPLFFRQRRMGMHGVPFQMWKFRTMLPSEASARAHHAPLDRHRITPLGHILRLTHIDELPNFINVLTGDMTLIGPRPDAWDHSVAYIDSIPYYHERFRVRPGITGLAQVVIGYADEDRTIRKKARLDHFYIRKSGFRLDLFILLRTVHMALTQLDGR